jgi:2-oxoglutarate ferredoxin oxidoreductase subunit gamma
VLFHVLGHVELDQRVVITEQELVRIDKVKRGELIYAAPATRLAEELGRKVVLNIVMVGFFGAVTNLLDREALRNAVADSVPESMKKLNLEAFDKGFEYGSTLIQRIAENGDAEGVLTLEVEA